MVATTFLPDELPPHSDKDLQAMLDEMTSKTGAKWEAVDRNYTDGCWPFRRMKTHTSLYQRLSRCEAQVLICVSTVKEAKAYLLGALGHMDKPICRE